MSAGTGAVITAYHFPGTGNGGHGSGRGDLANGVVAPIRDINVECAVHRHADGLENDARMPVSSVLPADPLPARVVTFRHGLSYQSVVLINRHIDAARAIHGDIREEAVRTGKLAEV